MSNVFDVPCSTHIWVGYGRFEPWFIWTNNDDKNKSRNTKKTASTIFINHGIYNLEWDSVMHEIAAKAVNIDAELPNNTQHIQFEYEFTVVTRCLFVIQTILCVCIYIRFNLNNFYFLHRQTSICLTFSVLNWVFKIFNRYLIISLNFFLSFIFSRLFPISPSSDAFTYAYSLTRKFDHGTSIPRVQHFDWSPMDNYHCDNACIQKHVPKI